MPIDKVVIITGSSRGIGAATARLFAENGYAVCINYRSDEESALSVEESILEIGGRCICVQADMSSEIEVCELFKQVDEKLGPLTCLVNNAGIIAPQSRVEDLSAERINTILSTNVTGFFLCSQQALKRMSNKYGGKGGAIVNVSSRASQSGSPNEYVDYAASKGAIDTFTKGLALEVAEEGIRVNCVRPGLIHTGIHADGGEPGRVERLKYKIPLQRGGQPAEVAEAVLWLASEKSSFVTGAVIDLSGGL